MATNRKPWVAAMVCAATVVGVTGCSDGDDTKAGGEPGKPAAATTTQAPVDPFQGLDADAIADRAVTAMKRTTSFRMVGNGKSDGEDMTVDLAIDDKGCTGQVTLKAATANILRADGVMYMKGDEGFWQVVAGKKNSSAKESAALTELLKGRWLKMPRTSAGRMADLCDADSLMKKMDDDWSLRRGMTKGADSDVDGKPAVTLIKKQGNGETLTMYVAKEGEPYILKTVEQGGDEPGTMVFSDHDKPFTATAPPADQVLDPSKLSAS